jgi:hypothetical protein
LLWVRPPLVLEHLRGPLHFRSLSTISPARGIVNILDIIHIVGMAKDTQFPIKKLLPLTEEQAAAISEYRFENRISSENEAIRQLIDLGLKAAKAQKPRGRK